MNSVRIQHLAVGLLVLLLAVPNAAWAAKGSGEYRDGKKAEAQGDFELAVSWFEKAVAKDSNNAQYLVALRRARFMAAMKLVDQGYKLRKELKLEDSLAAFQKALVMDPASSIAEQEVRRAQELVERQKAAPGGKLEEALTATEVARRTAERKMMRAEEPPELRPLNRTPINLRVTQDAKMIFETIGKLAGLNVLTDPDYQGRRIAVELNNVTLEDALDHVALLSRSVWKAVTPNTIFLYQENKRREHDPQVIKTVYLSNTIQPNELTEIAQSLRNLLDMQKVQQVNSQNAIILRDTPDKVAIAEKVIHDMDKSKPEVVVDVTVMQVRRDRARELGITPVSGGSPGLELPVSFAPPGASSSSTAVTLRRVGQINEDDYSIVLPSANAIALMTDARTKVLQNPQVRASDGVAAKLRIGERIPIATGSFQPGIGGVGINPLVNTQFQYTDVGVILEVTPKVHQGREISMKVVVEISAVTGRSNIGGIEQPIIGQRRVEEEIRLREGEVNVLGGIIDTQETKSAAGLPVLGQIPIIGRLFSTERKEVAESEVLIVLTPRIVRTPEISELNLRGLDVGTQTNISLRYRPPQNPAAPPLQGALGAPASPAALAGSAATPPSETAPPAPSGPPPPPSVPSGTRLKFKEEISNQERGARFPVTLEIENGSQITSVPLEIRYDARLLSASTVEAGAFLSRDGQQVSLTPSIDEAGGVVRIALTRGREAPPVSGSGVLVVVNFQAKEAGVANVRVVSATARGPEGERVLPGAAMRVTINR
jgi:general secretion pathway protein D